MASFSPSEADEINHDLAERLNDQMKKAVMPVTVFVGIEAVIGFFGNLVVLYIFLFRYHNCNYRYFVLCLAMIDILSTLTTIPGEIVTQLYWYVYPVPMVCKIKSFFNVFTVSSDTLCFLTIAVDRYRKVCQPLEWQIQPRIAKFLCIGINILAFIMAFPCAIFWGTHNENEYHYNHNITTTVCEKDEKYMHTWKPLKYSVSIETLLSISLAAMLFLYILIARKLIFVKKSILSSGTKGQRYGNDRNIEQEKSKEECSSSEIETSTGNEDNTDTITRSAHHHSSRTTESMVRRKTLIMFTLTLTFIVTTIIYLTMLSLIADGILPHLSDRERTVYFFFFRLYFINHVINPIVYGVLDPKFREIMRDMRNQFQT